MSDACLYQWVRSPRTRAKDTGGLHGLTPQALLGQLYGALATRAKLDPALVDDVILGLGHAARRLCGLVGLGRRQV